MAIYETYRPITFNNVVGNKITIKALTNHFSTPGHNHTILLTGETGCGKSTAARILARQLMGLDPAADLKLATDYDEINVPAYGDVDRMRKVIYQLNYRALNGGARVKFYDECSFFSTEAQGTLLKAMEDLPKDTYLFFATTDPDKLLPAFKSRCTTFHFTPPSEDEMVGLLVTIARKERKSVHLDVLEKIVQISGCRPRDTIVLLEKIFSLPEDMQMEALSMEPLRYESQHSGRAQPQNIANSVAAAGVVPGSPFACTSCNKLELLESIGCTSTALLEKEFTPPKIYVRPFVKESELMMFFAQAGAGKTWFVLLIALALTRINGKGFTLGPLYIEEQCGVVIIDGEMRPYDLQDRMKMLVGPMGDEHPDYPLTILTSDDMAVKYSERINLAEKEWRDAVFAYMEKNPVNKVLILDNLASLMPGINENSKAGYDVVNQWLLSLRSFEITVIIIHHANKSGGYRGHSGRIDNLDTVIGLKKMKGAEELCFQVDYEKARGAKPGDGLGFILEAVPHPENEEWLDWEQHAVEESSTDGNSVKNDLVMAYTLLEGYTQIEIAEKLGVSQPTVSNCKRQALKKDYIDEEGLTPEGIEFLQDVQYEYGKEAIELPSHLT